MTLELFLDQLKKTVTEVKTVQFTYVDGKLSAYIKVKQHSSEVEMNISKSENDYIADIKHSAMGEWHKCRFKRNSLNSLLFDSLISSHSTN